MKVFTHKQFSGLYFLACFTVLFLIYFSGHRAMLIDDGISGIWEIKMQGFPGYLKSYGFENFYYGHYAIVAILYFLFGLHTIGWYIFFIAMHALNTTLLYIVCKKIFSNTNTENRSSLMAFLGSVFFLLSPYQSENIIWAATSHYCASMCILLLSILWLIKKTTGEKTYSLGLFHLLFGISLVTLEISFLFPLVLLAVYFLYRVLNKNRLSLPDYGLKILLPQALLVFTYCLFHTIFFHSWIPHDRASHDTVFSFSHAITTLTQQMVKLFGFVHFLDYSKRETIYQSLLHWKRGLGVLVLIFTAISFFIYKKKKENLYISYFFILSAMLMYAPYMRLYFMWIARIENDRYNYFASAFLFSFFIFLLFHFHKSVRYAIIFLYIGTFITCLFPVISARKHSARMHQQYLAQLPVDSSNGKLYLLNVPASCKDAYMFRSAGRLGIAYQAIYNRDIFERVDQVAWYNAQSEEDIAEIKKVSDSSYHVQLKTDGSWWMQQSIGASDKENDTYSFKLDGGGGYLLTFKKKLGEEDKILLYSGGRFVINQ